MFPTTVDITVRVQIAASNEVRVNIFNTDIGPWTGATNLSTGLGEDCGLFISVENGTVGPFTAADVDDVKLFEELI